MLVVVASGRVVLYDMKEKRTVSKVDHGDSFAHVWQCLHREISLAPAVLKEQQLCPCPAGESFLQFRT